MEALRYDLASAIMAATVNYEDNWNVDSQGDFNDGEGIRYDGIMVTLYDYSDELLKELDGLQQESSEEFSTLARMVEQGEKDGFVSNYIAFSDINDDDSDAKIALVRSLEHYGQLKPYVANMRKASPEVTAGARALLIVANHVNHISYSEDVPAEVLGTGDHAYDFNGAPVLTNPEMVDLIMQRPEQASTINRIISERKVYDPETIRMVLDYPETALADGTL
jgi:hypothetical protein